MIPLKIVLLLWLCLGFFLGTVSLAAENASDNLGQEIAALFVSQKQADKDSAIEKELAALCLEAATEGIPTQLLLDKIREGVAKKQDATRILLTLTEEKKHLQAILVMLTRVDSTFSQSREDSYFRLPGSRLSGVDANSDPLATPASRMEIINQVDIFSRSGLSNQLLEQLFRHGVLSDKPYSQILELCRALIGIPGLTRFGEEEIFELARAVLDSRLSRFSYNLLPSLFLKGNRYNLQYTLIIQIIITKLDQKGGLTQIEQEFRRRGKRL